VHGHTRDVVAADLDLAGVDTDPHLDAERADRVDDRVCAVDGDAGAGKYCDESVSHCVDLASTEPFEFVADDVVMVVQKRVPAVVAERCGALEFALRRLAALCERAPSPPRLSSLARVAWEWGARAMSVGALRRFLDIVGSGDSRMDEPFWPASARFDAIAPGTMPSAWFAVSALEQFERTAAFSSYFADAGLDLSWLSRQPHASCEIERRNVLRRARAGQRIEVPPRLKVTAPDDLNAEAWRAGLVPNTFV